MNTLLIRTDLWVNKILRFFYFATVLNYRFKDLFNNNKGLEANHNITNLLQPELQQLKAARKYTIKHFWVYLNEK